MTPQQFKDILSTHNIHLTAQQEQQYQTYYHLLIEWNEKMNLTAITDEEEVYLKHFYDSVTLLLRTPLLQHSIHICDVGAGAGFPSIPLKILFPHLKVTIVDSLNKRITFLKTLVQELALDEVYCYHDRAETFAQQKQFREMFDVVTARAVARLNLLSELCIPLVKVGGYFAAMKASSGIEEKQEASKAIQILGGILTEDISFELPEQAGIRHILLIQKIKGTPKKYPRKAGIPAKNPLC
ncbi:MULTISPECIES: 16S rRNA (guanine(527)-N(7))-methyltransferase RsmG [unclassified Granulicatella]|uniref:16S rRNA (guanine(527)-N(7))-methyltransferase RsmG n=1 Tax=unclassified Granulicatella TaxID=2630493 RepID=UPI001072F3CE|nr:MULTISPECIES: 16S rRNA (guanine(527)-N(7))-methyltransferase RsmG [unclassified Granulicatella]MBF0780940.1 16S rRNA (guanine(527)-N(7))-methyltransferase RsmG [Granulicatella sp. 19428wC4_WM01]TFU92982.1 16S rRNA (guanine(527)-N(7))-methyltransferase RsmG [Granulicatella sp. WM01]